MAPVNVDRGRAFAYSHLLVHGFYLVRGFGYVYLCLVGHGCLADRGLCRSLCRCVCRNCCFDDVTDSRADAIFLSDADAYYSNRSQPFRCVAFERSIPAMPPCQSCRCHSFAADLAYAASYHWKHRSMRNWLELHIEEPTLTDCAFGIDALANCFPSSVVDREAFVVCCCHYCRLADSNATRDWIVLCRRIRTVRTVPIVYVCIQRSRKTSGCHLYLLAMICARSGRPVSTQMRILVLSTQLRVIEVKTAHL